MTEEQAASVPTMPATVHRDIPPTTVMTLLLLEALGALIILVLIVWWTMFSGRPNGELPPDESDRGTGFEKKQDK